MLCSSCAQPATRSFFDLIQYTLSQDSFARWVGAVLLVFVLWQVWRLFWLAIGLFWQGGRGIWRFFVGWARRRVIPIVLLGTLVWATSDWWVDKIQYIEQRFLHPVYVSQFAYVTADHAQSIYETELGRHTDAYERQRVLNATQATAVAIQSTPLSILEAAYLECGLNPFEVRRDRVAAGWIQFTRQGLGGLTYKGKPVAFDEVVSACARRDVDMIMSLTDAYLKDKYQRAGQKPLANTIDLYLAIFSPALIGAPSDKVVYSGKNDPRYYKNAGLDGWYTQWASGGRQLILRSERACDGKITVQEIYLCLESKKNRLISNYLKLN